MTSPKESPEGDAKESTEGSAKPAAMDVAMAEFQQRFQRAVSSESSPVVRERALWIECARLVSLPDTAAMEEIYKAFDEQDRRKWAELHGFDADATWEQMEAARTRDQWEEYAYDHGYHLEANWTFDLMRLTRWKDFVTEQAVANGVPLLDLNDGKDLGRYLGQVHRHKYYLKPHTLGDSFAGKIRADAEKLNIENGNTNLIFLEKKRRLHAEVLGNPALTVRQMQQAESQEEYAQKMGLVIAEPVQSTHDETEWTAEDIKDAKNDMLFNTVTKFDVMMLRKRRESELKL